MTTSKPPVTPAPLSVLLARAVLVLVALALAIAGLSVAVRNDAGASSAGRYSCPMHPEVRSARAAECPICKMALEPNDRRREIRKPPPSPQSSATSVGPATTRSPLGKTWLPETFPPAASARPSDRPALASPSRRTLVDGVRAPSWLETSERLAAVLYKDELVGLVPGEAGTFYAALTPRVPVPVRLSAESPEPWDGSTVLVRFALVPETDARGASGHARARRQGEVGTLELAPKARELLTFPESALLRSSEGPYVLVATTPKMFTRRPVQIGRIVKGQVVVLDGVGEHDRIVVGSAFCLDANAGEDAQSQPVAEIRR